MFILLRFDFAKKTMDTESGKEDIEVKPEPEKNTTPIKVESIVKESSPKLVSSPSFHEQVKR